jgi:hypothetical protein
MSDAGQPFTCKILWTLRLLVTYLAALTRYASPHITHSLITLLTTKFLHQITPHEFDTN